MSRELAQLAESYEGKYNPSDTPSGRRIAHREIGKHVKRLLEEKKIDPLRVSFKGLNERLVGSRGLEENIVASAFPTIASELISNVIIDGYQSYPRVADNLVRTVPSKLEESKIVGWTAIGTIRKVKEREPYSQAVPPKEKVFRIQNYKYGGDMDLTKEAIFFDKTGQLMDRARELGMEGARFREEIILRKVTDIDGDALDGSALYTSPNDNLLTTNPLGTPGWENTHTNLLEKKDDGPEQKPVWVMGDRPFMLVAPNLWTKAEKLRQAEAAPGSFEQNLQNDPNLARNMYDIVLNPYLAQGTTDWYYGSFKRQFRWEEVWPLETFTRVGQDTEEGFNRDIIQQFKVSLFGGCGAVDTRFVVKNVAT